MHWVTAIRVIIGWVLGQFNDAFSKGPPRAFAIWTHMTLASWSYCFWLGRPLEIGSRVSHWTLYAPLLVVPFVGIVVHLKRGNALSIFGLWEFASPWPTDRAVARSVLRVHAVLANALLILAGIHSGAVLIHHYVVRDRTLARMLPGAS